MSVLSLMPVAGKPVEILSVAEARAAGLRSLTVPVSIHFEQDILASIVTALRAGRIRHAFVSRNCRDGRAAVEVWRSGMTGFGTREDWASGQS